jgi:hypothetical protein
MKIHLWISFEPSGGGIFLPNVVIFFSTMENKLLVRNNFQRLRSEDRRFPRHLHFLFVDVALRRQKVLRYADESHAVQLATWCQGIGTGSASGRRNGSGMESDVRAATAPRRALSV